MDTSEQHFVWRDFQFVLGYVPEVDEWPLEAQRLGLPYRGAAVLRDDYEAPHSVLYWALVAGFVGCLDTDVVFEVEKGMPESILTFTNIASMRKFVDLDSEFRIPFSRATFYNGGQATSIILLTEIGAEPYHDAWTFEIYRNNNDFAELKAACYKACEQFDHKIEAEVEGQPHPQRMRYWKRLVRWFWY